MTKSQRIEALAKYIGCGTSEIEPVSYDPNTFTVAERQEYRVLTDSEADKACADYIRDSAWAFQSSFIGSHTQPVLNDKAVKALHRAQESLCEDANDLVLALIRDFDAFVSDAISADGRGNFLAGYDNEEHEVIMGDADSDRLYIYRTN